MNQLPNSANQLGQSTLLQLHMCKRALDTLGAGVAAAHVDAAIQSARTELGPDGAKRQMAAYPDEFFDKMYVMIDDVFGSTNGVD